MSWIHLTLQVYPYICSWDVAAYPRENEWESQFRFRKMPLNTFDHEWHFQSFRYRSSVSAVKTNCFFVKMPLSPTYESFRVKPWKKCLQKGHFWEIFVECILRPQELVWFPYSRQISLMTYCECEWVHCEINNDLMTNGTFQANQRFWTKCSFLQLKEIQNNK